MPYDQITGTKATELAALIGTIPDDRIVIVADPVTGELLRSTFGQMKSDIITAFGGISFLDPIVEVATVADLPQPGAIKTLYVITTGIPDNNYADANTQWRWGGSMYIEFPHGGDGDVSAEAVIRANADTALQAALNAEITARQNADSSLQANINNEATSRANADTLLSQQLAAEANTRSNNDNILQGLINTEGTTRQNADTDLQNQINQKLNASDYNDRFKGKYLTLAALQTAFPTATIGDSAQVDAGAGDPVKNYFWDTEEGWVLGSSTGASIHNTDEVPEGSTNLYFTAARAQAAVDLSDKVDKITGYGLISSADLTKLAGIATGAQVNDANTTLQGNTFNGANQLVKLDAGGKLPAVDGSQLTNLPSSGGGGGSYYGTTTGTNTYSSTIAGIAAYTAGLTVEIKFTNANTGPSTINYNALGPRSIVKNGSAALAAGDIPAGAVLTLSDDGVNMQIVGSINALPVVASGEKAVTVQSNGAHADYDIVDAASATATTGAQLESMDWSAGVVTKTGKAGEERWWNNWYYRCRADNTWVRMPFNMIVNDYVIGAIDDSAAKKSSAQMAALYPNALMPQIVRGSGGIYQYYGIAGWFYFQNTI